MRNIFILSFIITICSTCNNSNPCENVQEIDTSTISIEFVQLQEEFINAKSRKKLKEIINNHPAIAEYFLQRREYPNDSIMVEVLHQRLKSPHIDTLLQEVNRVFGNLDDLKEGFTQTFATIRHYYPDFTIPKIKTIATGFDNDLFVSDTLIIIGLDYYLGKKAKYRPIGFANYILERYQKEYIIPSVVLLYGISPQFNSTNTADKTMLAEMIDYGKSFYFAKRMMPCTADSLLIWYSQEDIDNSHENERIIWAHFLDKELLYTTNKFSKQKYLGERPRTYDIGEKCPGRIGTWLGWQIVNQYMEKNPNTTLQQLMKIKNSKKIFEKSHYRP